MKKSYYNFIFPGEDGGTVLYNSRTGAMAELDEEHTKQLEKLSEQELEEQNPDFAKALLDNGFAVADEVSELDMIRYDMLRTRFGNRTLVLTITPTLNCNFGCKYCYEKDVVQNQYMSEETQKAIIEYIENNVFAEGDLHINWYGGEPLLALDIIDKMSKQILQICDKKKIKYNAEIITNGYLLTEDVVENLLKNEIHKIQITLDGNKETHDQRRPLLNGKGTYDVIWENLSRLKKYRDKLWIALRVNVDKNNEEAVYEVERQVELQGMDELVCVYPGKVMAVGNCYQKSACFNNSEFAVLEQQFSCSKKNRIRNSYPYPKHTVCVADNNNAIVVDAEGFLYRCWMEIGKKERSIGNIKEVEGKNEQVLYEYVLYDDTGNEKCKKCKYLPICLGGCPYNRIANDNNCILYKYSMDRYMEYIPHEMKQKK